MKIRRPILTASIAAAVLAGGGCARVQAKAAFKEGNRYYKEENYKKAVEQYQRAVDLNPNMPEAYFYLASSYQSLYRPGKEGDDNKQRLQTALDLYQKAVTVNDGSTPNLQKIKRNTLGALTSIYSDDPFKDFDKALSYAQQLVQDNPSDPRNLFAMGNLYEKFGKIEEAEQAYAKAFEAAPQDVKACNALAAFYNKPLWDGKSKFDSAIEVLEKCAGLAPNDPAGYYRIAQFYWDKAYRDPLLDDTQKDGYADKGLAEVDKALAIKPDHIDAIVYKGLLYRVKAQVSRNPKLRMQYLDQAQTLQKQALDMKKDLAAAAPSAAPSPAGS